MFHVFFLPVLVKGKKIMDSQWMDEEDLIVIVHMKENSNEYLIKYSLTKSRIAHSLGFRVSCPQLQSQWMNDTSRVSWTSLSNYAETFELNATRH